MAHFYGTLQGVGAEVSRTGLKSSGVQSKLASNHGAVEVHLWHDAATGKDMFRVEQVRHRGTGVSRVIEEGELGK